MVIGLGLGLGPVVGSALYHLLPYDHTIYCFSGVVGLALVMSIFMLPDAVNQDPSAEATDPNEDQAADDHQRRP